MTTPTPTLEQLATTVAAMQSDIARLQTDVAALKAAAVAREDEAQRAREWLRSLQRVDTATEPKPRETDRA